MAVFTSDTVRVLLAVLDHGSFSAAARQLGRVPSAVSMTIAQLEAELDLRLFDRTAREARPTAVARALEPRARQIALQLRQLDSHALALHQGLEQRLTLAIAPELMSAGWSAPLARLAAEYPSLEVAVLSVPQSDALRMVHDGGAQLALVFERPGFDDREGFQELGSEVLIAVIAPSHPRAGGGRHRLRHEDLFDIRQIAVVSRDADATDPRILISRQLWRTDSHLATLSLVLAGLGWAYLPARLVDDAIAAGRLLAIDFENLSNALRLWVDVVWANDRPQGRGTARLIELMREGFLLDAA